MKGVRPSRIFVRKRKKMWRCKMMLWWVMFVIVVEAQEIRIPAYIGRTPNKPVIRIIPSDILVRRMKVPEKPISENAVISNRTSTITRIQPTFYDPRVIPRINLVGVLDRMKLRRMSNLIQMTQLQPYLRQAGPVTLFAPTDEAFSLSNVPTDPRQLREFVLQHVVSGRVMPTDVRNDVLLPSLRLTGTPLRLNVYDDGQVLSVSGSQFLDDPQDVGNIRIQPVDRVLSPISNADLTNELRMTFPRMYEMLMKTALAPQLTSGTFTLFSPTEEAFSSLNPEVQEKLMQNSTLLLKVLLNHIVPGTHYSAVLAHGYALRALGGEPIHVTNRRGLILVNGIPIVRNDISVTNGVIHAINRLLLPQELYTRRKPATMAPPPPREDPIPASSPPLVSEYVSIPVFMEPSPPVPRTLTKTLATPLRLPDGSLQTFSTANSLLRRSLLLSTLKNNGSGAGYTMLVPTDAAYAALGPQGLDQLRRNSRLLRRMLLRQLVEGKLNLSANAEEKDRPIRSLGGTIVVSSFNGGNSLTVGGARVLSIRQAADGLVLVTDKVNFPPPTRTVVDALSPFPKFTDLVKNRMQIQDSLTTEGSVYTIFAPTDKALSVLSPSQLKDRKFISELFWSHVVPGAFYRSRLTPGLRLTTVMGNTILIHRSPTGELFVNEKPVAADEIVAGNGVIHRIDSLLFFPQIAVTESPSMPLSDDQNLRRIATEFNATWFLDWIKKAGLENFLKTKDFQKKGCTLFLPTNRGLNGMSSTLRRVTLGDSERLKKFIQFHISPQGFSWNSVRDNSFMPSLLPRKRIRCNIYAKGRIPGSLTVCGSRVTAIHPLSPGSNVTVAVIDEPMSPPVSDLPLAIAKTPMLKNFTKILKISGMDTVISDEGPYTLFAPNACAFTEMDSEEYQRLITNRKNAIEFVKRYLVKGCYYTNGLQDGQKLRTEANTYIIVQVTPDCVIVSDSKVLYGDMSATNGVLHVIASLMTS